MVFLKKEVYSVISLVLVSSNTSFFVYKSNYAAVKPLLYKV